MKNFISDFVYKEIKGSLILAAAVGVTFYFTFGFRTMSSFCIGFIIGCINFLLMSYCMNFLVNSTPRTAMGIHLVMFVARYIIIGFAFFELVKNKNANIFALALGVIIINISLVLDSLKKSPSYAEEV